MVIWTDRAILHITEFIDETSENTEETAKSYMRKLVDYVDILEKMPQLGKNMQYVISKYELRQLMYRKHRVIYHIKGKDIVILSVLHTRLDLGKALSKLKKDIK